MAVAANRISTDLITPLGAYVRLRSLGPSFLLESVEKGRLGRHSFAGYGTRLVGFEEAREVVAGGSPVIGYLGYDNVAALEPVVLPDRGGDLPVTAFVVPDLLLEFDHLLGTAEVIVGDAERAEAILAAPIGRPEGEAEEPARATKRFPDQETYEEQVRVAKEHIRAGDVFQIVLSQRAERATSAGALDIYRSLRRINPSPYLFLLELRGFSLIGSSPEALVKLDGSRASVNPIAGTAPTGPGAAEQLLASEKDRAEHVMLVDLARNDLSRACRPGTVQVERYLEPEAYSHVTHLVSEVVGELRDGVRPFDLLVDCFPAGTVTGAPKVRAMQLISEIEGYRRGAYGGTVAYCLPDGTLDACIAIRMIVLNGGVAHLQAGAGIVADSDPELEHRECLAKLAALEAAIDEAEGQL
ncbi:MAG: anthranilate synthase component I family protein [Actinomycetota bacterium]